MRAKDVRRFHEEEFVRRFPGKPNVCVHYWGSGNLKDRVADVQSWLNFPRRFWWLLSTIKHHLQVSLDVFVLPWCSKMSWMTIDAKVVSWCNKGFIWILKMSLPAAGCLECVLMLKLFPDTPIECILMNLLCLHEPRELCTCSRCPLMQLDVLDGFDAQDDPWHSWMSNNSQVVLWCTETFLWMVKITLVVAGCLGCL